MKKQEKAPLPSYTSIPALRPLKKYVTEYLQLRDEVKPRKARMKELMEYALPMLAKARVEGVMVGDEPVLLIESSQSKLSAQRLVELGVSVEIIKQATITTPKAPYLKIGKQEPRSYGGEE